jgi:hypothetical protein
MFCLLLILGTFECTELCFRVQISQKRSSDNTESLFCGRTDFWLNRSIIVIIVFYFVLINNLIIAGTAEVRFVGYSLKNSYCCHICIVD